MISRLYYKIKAQGRIHLHDKDDTCKFVLYPASCLLQHHIFLLPDGCTRNMSDRTCKQPEYVLIFFDKLKLKTK